MDARFDKNCSGSVLFILPVCICYTLPDGWRSLSAFGMAISQYLTYGRRIVIGVGLRILLLGLGSWSRLVPEPSQWGHVVAMQRTGMQ